MPAFHFNRKNFRALHFFFQAGLETRLQNGLRSLALLCLFMLFACDEKPSTIDTKQDETKQDETASQIIEPADQSRVGPEAAPAPASQPSLEKSVLSETRTEEALNDAAIVLDAGEVTIRGKQVLAIAFSRAIKNRQNFSQHINITSKSKNMDPAEVTWTLDESGVLLYTSDYEPQTQYRLTVQDKALATFDKAYVEGSEKRFYTQARPFHIRIENKGKQFSPHLSSGLEISSMNLSEIEAKVYRVPNNARKTFLALQDRYSQAQSYRDKLDLIHTARFKVEQSVEQSFHSKTEKGKPSKRFSNIERKSLLNLSSIEALEEPGLYHVVVSDAFSPNYYSDRITFSVSDIALQLRTHAGSVIAIVQSIKDGAPLDNAKVALYNNRDELIQTKLSNKNGLAEFALAAADLKKARIVSASKGGERTVMSAVKAGLDLSELQSVDAQYQALSLLLFSHRDVYRPGETVIIDGLLQNLQGNTPKGMPLTAKLIDPNGRLTRTWQLTPEDSITSDTSVGAAPESSAYYHYRFNTDRTTKTGEWRLSVDISDRYREEIAFLIEEFMPERMAIDFTVLVDNSKEGNEKVTASETLLMNDAFALNTKGRYLYGAPANENKIEARISTRAEPTLTGKEFEPYQKYRFAAGATPIDAEEINGVTNNDGEFAINIKPIQLSTYQSVKTSIEVSLFESGGRPVTRTHSLTRISGQALIGLKVETTEKPSGDLPRVKPNGNAQVSLIAVDQNGNRVESEGLRARLYFLDKYSYRRYNRDWDFSKERAFPVWSERLALSAKDDATLSLPVEYGTYRLDIEYEDRPGMAINSAVFFAGYGWDDPDSKQPDAVQLSWDQEAYNSGDLAKLTVQAPYPGHAIITIENNALRYQSSFRINSNELQEKVVAIPIDQNMLRADTYATAMVVSDRKQSQVSRILPKRALGLLSLPQSGSVDRLDLRINSKNAYRPQDTVELEISIDNAELLHAYDLSEARVIVSAVDSGVLSVTNFQHKDPFHYFAGAKRYAATIRDTWGSLIRSTDAHSLSYRFGGDLAARSIPGGDSAKSDVQVVSLYNNETYFDKNGNARVKLTLPYFNGSLKLTAVAFVRQTEKQSPAINSLQSAQKQSSISRTAHGMAEKTIKVSAPLIAQINMPRFVAPGDKTQATFNIRNNTAASIRLQALARVLDKDRVKTNDSNADLRYQINQTLTLKPDERSVITLPLKAESLQDSVDIELSLSSINDTPITGSTAKTVNETSDLSFTRVWKLAVRPPYPIETQIERQELSANGEIELQGMASENYHSAHRFLELSINRTPDLGQSAWLSSLLRYPYGCLEQTTSRALPLLTRENDELQPLINRYNLSQKNRGDQSYQAIKDARELIRRSIERVQSFQTSSGGFSLWEQGGEEEPYVSIYATDFLLQAKQRAYTVDDQILGRAIKRLSNYLRSGTVDTYSQGYNQYRDARYRTATKAYAALILARAGELSLGDLKVFANENTLASATALSYARLASAFTHIGDTQRSAELWKVAIEQMSTSTVRSSMQLTRSSETSFGDYGSEIRDRALIHSLLRQRAGQSNTSEGDKPFDGQVSLLPLFDRLARSTYLSTQEKASLLELTAVLESAAHTGSSARAINNDSIVLTTRSSEEEMSETLKLTDSIKRSFHDADIPGYFYVRSFVNEPLFVTKQSAGYRKEAPKPVSSGISLARRFYTLEGTSLEQLSAKAGSITIDAGDIIVVDITVDNLTDAAMPHALLVDFLPAGIELENPRLMHSINVDELLLDSKPIASLKQGRIAFDEYRDDRFLTALSLSARESARVFYAARAVTKGSFALPASQAEDMYQPSLRAVGEGPKRIIIR